MEGSQAPFVPSGLVRSFMVSFQAVPDFPHPPVYVTEKLKKNPVRRDSSPERDTLGCEA